MNILKRIPFTYHWILKRAIGSDVETILDLGCGGGELMNDLAWGEKWKITGVELYLPLVSKAKLSGIYTKVIKADVTNLPKYLLKGKFDVIFASQILEHLPKQLGKKALEEWEGLAKKRVILSTPVGFIKYERIESHGDQQNPLQRHLSGWSINELRTRGYSVIGQGLKFIYGRGGFARKFPYLFSLLGIISFLAAPFVYFYPTLGTYMIAVKKK